MRMVRILLVALAVIAALLIGAGTTHAQTSGWLGRSIDREVSRLAISRADTDFSATRQQSGPQKRNWIQRHPALFGAMVGFGGGFLVGYLPGDDAVFDDFVASFNGLVIGGVGAMAGAIVGEVGDSTRLSTRRLSTRDCRLFGSTLTRRTAFVEHDLPRPIALTLPHGVERADAVALRIEYRAAREAERARVEYFHVGGRP